MTLVLIYHNINRTRYLFRDLKNASARSQLIQFTAKDHQRRLQTCHSCSQIKIFDKVIEFFFIIVVSHKHKPVLVCRGAFLENPAKTWFKASQSDSCSAQTIGNRIGQNGSRIGTKASAEHADAIRIEITALINPG